jgi:hypothetical protein
MTIDERLAFLLQSTESLHASAQELHATVAEHSRQMLEHSAVLAKIEAREKQARLAILEAIRAYLEALGKDGI